MTQFECGQYVVKIDLDPTYTNNSTDNVNQYDFVYFKESYYRFNSITGIKVYQDEKLIKSAVIGAEGGATGIHENSLVVEDDRVVVCCSDSIFCLSIPDLSLLWQTKADSITCFEIFSYHDTYIVHGEMGISRIAHDGNLIWQKGGADIFVTLSGTNNFKLTDEYIMATDFNYQKYYIDYDGNFLE